MRSGALLSMFLPHPARRLCVALLGALVLVTMHGEARAPVHATDPGQIEGAIEQQRRLEGEIAAQRDQLGQLKEQQGLLTADVERVVADLRAVGARLTDAEERLAAITTELETTRATLARYRARIARLADQLAEVAADIIETRRELAQRTALLEDHLRIAYEQSQVSVLEVLASSETLGDAATELGAMVALSEEDERLAREIRETRRRLEIRQETLEDGRVRLHALEAEASEREALLAEQQQQADAARALLDEQRRRLDAYRAEQEAALAAVAANRGATEDLLAARERSLAGQRKLVQQLTAEAARLEIAYRGRFAWPEKGDFIVTQEFGKTSFDDAHTGIDLAYHDPRLRCGGPVYAVADGVVLADGQPNTAYGDGAVGVVIGHSQRLQTWYWHLSREVVSKGQKVKAGELIGYEGKTGIATGCHLHLQVMLDGNAVEPRAYLPRP